MTKVAIIGARRRRQGIGEFVANFFAAQGAEVTAVLGTTQDTLSEARAHLKSACGIDCRGYLDLGRLLADEKVDVLAICSPTDRHIEHLKTALDFGVNVLCDKPLCREPGPDGVETVSRLARGFAAKNLYLDLLTQWPSTLDVFQRIHPIVDLAAVRSFSMSLGTASRGLERVSESASHGISMLQALAGPGEIQEIAVSSIDDGMGTALDFNYRHGRGVIQTRLEFVDAPNQPRPASYSINGAAVERSIDLKSYSISLTGAGKAVAVDDPLKSRIGAYLSELARGKKTDVAALIAGVKNLKQLVSAAGAHRPMAARS